VGSHATLPATCVPVRSSSSAVVVAASTNSSGSVTQGLKLVHFSAQLEPCLSQDTPYTPYTPPDTPVTWVAQPLRAPPIPYKALKLS